MSHDVVCWLWLISVRRDRGGGGRRAGHYVKEARGRIQILAQGALSVLVDFLQMLTSAGLSLYHGYD